MYYKIPKLLISFTFALLVFYLFGCSASRRSSTPKYFRDSIPIVSFYDLPKHKGKKVYLQSWYSGNEEYWSLKALNGRFDQKLSVELQFKEWPHMPPPNKYDNLFDSVYNHYPDRYLLIDAIGTFSNDNKNGYGHLGSNNSVFIVSELIDVQLYNKITRTKIPLPTQTALQ